MKKINKLLLFSSILMIIFSLIIHKKNYGYAQEKKAGQNINNDEKNRHMVIAIGGGIFNPFDRIGDVLGMGGNAKIFFQYNKIAKGFGMEAETGYNYIADKELENSFVGILPVIVSPLYMFETKYMDFQLKAGIGFAYVSGFIDGNSTGSSVDLTISTGFSLSHTFNNGFYLGFDTKYYYIFETKGANCISASVMLGYSF